MPLLLPTATDALDATALGLTLLHHELTTYPESAGPRYSPGYEAALQAALAQVRALQARGVATLCVPAPLDQGQDVHLLQRVALETGMALLVGTGVQVPGQLPPAWQPDLRAPLAAALRRDLAHGVAGMGIRAAFLQCPAPDGSPAGDQVLAAVARAQRPGCRCWCIPSGAMG